MSESASLRITEIFTSLQGEALSAGYPTTFVRLTGCPLRCVYCDSAYAFNGGEQRSIAEVVAEVKNRRPSRVCVTGGEPLAQPNCRLLLSALGDAGYSVSLETSGAMDISEVDPRVSIVLDIKTPGSGESQRNLLTNLPKLKSTDQIKVVVTSQEDFRWFEILCDQHPEIFQAQVVWISPAYEQVDLKDLASWVIDSAHPFRMQLQLHKLIWGEEIGR